MRPDAAAFLRCPACHAEGRWDIRSDRDDQREIREGELTCQSCGTPRRIRDGIVELMHEPPEFVTREAAGLERFAEFMRNDGWDRKMILELPKHVHGYWYMQALAMNQLMEDNAPGVTLSPGQRVLDVGSNTCWASAMFAERGLDVVALDIAPHLMQGLRTADWWFEDRGIFFERVMSVMFEPALASESFDVIWCCEVLHHNHRANLTRTLGELYRLLKPGGHLVVVNEPVRALKSPKLNPGAEVAEFEGHEHAYVRRSYIAAARRAGFDLELYAPPNYPIMGDGAFGVSARMSTLGGFKVASAHAVRRNRVLRAGYLAWQNYVNGISLQMIGTKAPAAA